MSTLSPDRDGEGTVIRFCRNGLKNRDPQAVPSGVRFARPAMCCGAAEDG